MKFTKRRLRIGRLMLSWTAVVSILWIPVCFVLGNLWHQSAGFTTMTALVPMIPVMIKRREHFYLMKRNLDFDQYRLDK